MSQVQASQDNPKYARFTRRVQGLMYDSMIMVIAMVVTLSLATAGEGIGASRLIGFAGAAIILLYEPVMVSMRGGTFGHSLRNLRVADDRTHGNVSFLKAVVRYVIKLVLGLLSFLTMATTQRHQAIHDLLTGSTVRIRDESQADLLHYHLARTELADQAMPSRLRRVVAIFGYLLAFVAPAFVAISVLAEKMLTSGCLRDETLCTTADQVTLQVVGLGFLAICALILVLGWRGKLPGCRRATTPVTSRSQQT